MSFRQKVKILQRNIVNKRLQKLYLRQEYSNIIAKKILSLENYLQAKSIMVYLALPKEVDTKLILADAFNKKETICVPVTKEKLHLVKIDKETELKKGKFNVLEPGYGDEIDDVDIAIIPMVAFDAKCNRLGHGKGYFDKFLQDKKCFKIGIAFEKQKFFRLSIMPNDIKMDMVVTEKKIYYKDK
ncbi:MAG: 5-formyltetrahydrofolate cyclo-ligase [Clostridiales bacterium]|nr:5-formyltetrahydrofolate cyclo-ligase [Clostridiales bacterium]